MSDEFISEIEPVPEVIRRPVATLIFGILNLVFGAQGLLCAPFAILLQYYGADLMKEALASYPEWYQSLLIPTMIFGMVISVFFLIAGIGLIRLAPWSYRISLTACGLGILSSIANAALLLGVLLSTQEGDNFAANIVGFGSGFFTAFFCTLIYGTQIFFLSRPNVTRALNP